MKRKVKCPECGYEKMTTRKPLNDICPFCACNIIMETVKEKTRGFISNRIGEFMSEKEVKEQLLEIIQKWGEENDLETSAEMDVELALSVLELFNKAIKEAVEKGRTRAL